MQWSSLVCSISIHSLVKRETAPLNASIAQLSHFNPLPRKEGDRLRLRQTENRLRFQSTPS